MFSNNAAIFEQLARTFFRAALYVSYADTSGVEGFKKTESDEAQKAELKALHHIISLLERQHSPDEFIHDVARLAKKQWAEFEFVSVEDVPALWKLKEDLYHVPEEVGKAIELALAHFSREEARLYTDLLMSVAGSIAQAHDEWDDVDWPRRIETLFMRLLGWLGAVGRKKEEKFLYDINDVLDEMKFSTEENIAIGEIGLAIQNAWAQYYPGLLDEQAEKAG